MSDEKRIPTLTVVINVYDREVVVSGENLAALKNSTIQSISIRLKKAARMAKRTIIRDYRSEVTDADIPAIPAIHGEEIPVSAIDVVVTDEKQKLTMTELLSSLNKKTN